MLAFFQILVSGNFNPRSPHGERPKTPNPTNPSQIFQSTLPARGATCCATNFARRSDFNPRSPHGERRYSPFVSTDAPSISIHAPRTGSDTLLTTSLTTWTQFQSTLPARGATGCKGFGLRSPVISIHAPRTGSDPSMQGCAWKGERFQSTLPARGATVIFDIILRVP